MSNYEEKPGSFTISKNDKKTTDKHPDYKGKGVDLSGTPVWVSGWVKKSQFGSFLSLSMSPRESIAPKVVPVEVDEDDIPF